MAEKKPQIVIKKITVVAGGAHGGAWKVAFADFMTAMMAFFLVMWLLATQSDAQKKAISDYFSTPSVIEYQFNNYGAELTLEKLFMDLINEPLKTFSNMIAPMDRTPNIMSMGIKKIVMSYMADQLGGIASNVSVSAESVVFEIPDIQLFIAGTANPNSQFVSVMERVKGVTAGLEDSDVFITSLVYDQSVDGGNHQAARNVAESRLDMIQGKVRASLESSTVDVTGKSQARNDDRTSREKKGNGGGFIRLEIKQKKVTADGKKPKKIKESAFSGPATARADDSANFDKLVDQVSKKKRRK